MPRYVVILAACVLGVAAAACGPASTPRQAPLPVTLPDMSRSDEGVQTQARERYAALMQKIESRASDSELAAAYGDVGMLLQAAEYFEAAEPAYVNAQTLVPADARWRYYLAHVYRRQGDAAKSIDSFRQALERQPGDVPTLLWLSRMLVDQGRSTDAEPLLARAQAGAPRAVAVLADLGQLALSTRDYARAVTLFEQALTIDAGAASLHAPLATAYRGLGELAKAEVHAKQWRSTEVPVADPLMDRLAATLQSGVSYETRGVRAFEAGQWSEAAALFRDGIALTPPATPLGRSLRQKLALALQMGGDTRGAVEQLEEAVRLAPAEGLDEPAAQAHYGLGIISASSGRDAEAIDHLSKAVAYSPKYAQAQLVLGDLLRRTGRFTESLPHYADAVQVNAKAAEARLGYGLSLVRLGRDVEARTWFEEAVRAQPDRTELIHALARLLAAAPDAKARDGQRALTLVRPLIATIKRSDLGETMAMALAEVGDFDEAVNIQRAVMRAADRAGLRADVQRMAVNLRLYERRLPCRTPWTNDDPVALPGPRTTPSLPVAP